jgi:hypothetical protein
MASIEYLTRWLNGLMEETDGSLSHTLSHTLMNNVISLKERLLKNDLARAEEKLKEARILISSGKYEFVEKAMALERIIEQIEEELVRMIEDDLLF